MKSGTVDRRFVRALVSPFAAAWLFSVFFPAIPAMRGAAALETAAAVSSSAAESVPTPTSPPLRFRRVYVPLGDMDAVRDRVPYYPMAKDDFEALLTLLNRSALEDPARAYVAEARYSAVLDGESLLGEEAHLEVILRDAEPAVLSLEPTNLAVRDPIWESSAVRQATLGVGPQGGSQLWVTESGTLRFGWSVAGRRQPDGSLRFEIRFPPSLRGELELFLPEALRLEKIEGGAVVAGPAGSGSRNGTHIVFAAGAKVDLLVVRPQFTDHSVPRAEYREETAFDCSLGGLDLMWQWSLSVPGEPLSELLVNLPPGVRVTGVVLAGSEAAWSEEHTDDGSPGRLIIRPDSPIEGRDRILRIQAVMPLWTDRRLELPVLNAAGCARRSSRVELIVRAPLEVTDLMVQGGQVTQFSSLPSDPGGKVIQLNCFDPRARIGIDLRAFSPAVICSSATQTLWGADEASADVLLYCENDSGALWTWTVPLAEGWVPQRVESVEPSALADWAIETRSDGRKSLRTRWNRALVPERPALLRLTADRPWNGPHPREVAPCELVPLDMDAAETGGRHSLSVRLSADLARQWQLRGAGKLDQERPSEVQALEEFLAATADLRIQDVAAGSRDYILRLVPRTVRHDVRGTCRILLDRDTISERLWVFGRQTGPGEGPLRIGFVGGIPAASEIEWRVQQPDGTFAPCTARRIAPDPPATPARSAHAENRSAGDAAAPAISLWEVDLPEETDGDFTILAWREGRFSPGHLALPFFADDPHAPITVELFQREGVRAGLTVRGLEALPIMLEEAPEDFLWAGTFSYTASNGNMPRAGRGTPAIVVTPGEASQGSAWADQCVVLSAVDGSGRFRHIIRTRVDHLYAGKLRWTLPDVAPSLQVVSAKINGRRVRWSIRSENGDLELALDAVPDQPVLIVELECEQAGQGGGLIRRLQPAIPTPVFPVASMRWVLFVPPDLEAVSLYDLTRPNHRWTALPQRLLGPLRRPEDRPLLILEGINQVLFSAAGVPPDAAVRNAENFLLEVGRHCRRLSAPPAPAPQPTDSAGSAGNAAVSAGEPSSEGVPPQGQPLTWGRLFSDSLIEAAHSHPPSTRAVLFLADAAMLERVGVRPWSPIPQADWDRIREAAARESDDRVLGKKVLEELGLVLLIGRRAVTLTAREQLPFLRDGDNLAWSRPPLFKLVAQSAWWERFEQAAIQDGNGGICRIRVWNELPGLESRSEQPERGALDHGALPFQIPVSSGWRAKLPAVPSLAAPSDTTLWLLPRVLVDSARWIALLLALAVCVTLIRRRRRLLWFLAVACVIAELFVPDVLAPLVSGVFLGTVLGFVVVLLLPLGGRCTKDASRGGCRIVGNASKALLFGTFCLAALDSAQATQSATAPQRTGTQSRPLDLSPGGTPPTARIVTVAEESPVPDTAATVSSAPAETPPAGPTVAPSTPAASRPPYRVFIPTDEQGNPIGKEVYLSEDFYRELQRGKNARLENAPAWLLLSADYRGSLIPGTDTAKYVLPELQAVWECVTFKPDAEIELRVGGEQGGTISGGILLDGRPAAAALEGNVLRCVISQVGRHRIQARIMLSSQLGESYSGVRVRVPPVADSRIELAISPDIAQIEAVGAVGAARRDPEGTHWSVDLGAAEVVVLRWYDRPALLGGGLCEADELSRLHITPGGPTLDVYWRLRVVDGRLHRIRAAFDPELQWLGAEGSAQPIAQLLSDSPARPVLQIDFPQPVTETTSLRLMFQFKEGGGWGRVTLPTVTLLDGSLSRRRLALAVDPGIQVRPDDIRGWDPLSAAAIAETWPEAGTDIAAAYQAFSGRTYWAAVAEPVLPELVADESVQVRVERDRALLRWQFLVPTEREPRSYFRLRVPPEWKLRSASLYCGASERPVRITDSSMLLLWNDREYPGDRRIVVEGEIPHPPSGQFTVPKPELLDARLRTSSWNIYRSPDTWAEVSRCEGLSTEPSLPPVSQAVQDVPVVTLAARDPQSVEVELSVRPNDPTIRGKRILILERKQDRWVLQAMFPLLIEGGTASELRLFFPPGSIAGIPAAPAATVLPDANEDASSYRLIAANPWAGSTTVQAQAQLQLDSGGRLIVPLPELDGIVFEDTVLLLPLECSLEEEATELDPAAIREIADFSGLPLPEYRGYRMAEADLGHDSRGVVVVPARTRPARIPFADVVLRPTAGDGFLAVIDLQIDVGDWRELRVDLPAGGRILQVWQEGNPLPIHATTSPRQVGIPLPGTPRTRLLTLVFEGRVNSAAAGGSAWLALPQFDVPIESCVFAVFGDPRRPSLDSGRLTSVSAWEYHSAAARACLDRMSELLENPARADEETRRRFAFWREAFESARQAARAVVLLHGKGLQQGPSAETRLANLELAASRVLEKGREVFRQPEQELVLIAPPMFNETVKCFFDRGFYESLGGEASYGTATEYPRELLLVLPPAVFADRNRVFFFIIPIALALLLTPWIPRRITDALGQWLLRFPHPVVVFFGVTWWFWMNPPFVGWIFIGLGIYLLLRPKWLLVHT
ncbi:MAG: hypothetical protein GYA33_00180, partial [Thermogutta sp.]|nr:hypothetical protein [Thermogutta sp.]